MHELAACHVPRMAGLWFCTLNNRHGLCPQGAYSLVGKTGQREVKDMQMQGWPPSPLLTIPPPPPGYGQPLSGEQRTREKTPWVRVPHLPLGKAQ